MPQLKPMRAKRNRSPVATIHRQSESSGGSRKHGQRQRPSTLTTSVNSVRAPVTHYQLLSKSPQLSTIIEKDKSSVGSDSFSSTSSSGIVSQPSTSATEHLYPGKRFLFTEDSLKNNSTFTNSVFCPPTPTEENAINQSICVSFHSPEENPAHDGVIGDRLHKPPDTICNSVDSSGSQNQPSSDSEESSEDTSTSSALGYSSLESV
ncbi:uncharacterized protein LOC142240338 [Haematobia irritans]|uniref:uncharacterized protein LOC142240338 n=1 Tax=Haematobia irritans TaxID=7368 RepID=UPI003F50632E